MDPSRLLILAVISCCTSSCYTLYCDRTFEAPLEDTAPSAAGVYKFEAPTHMATKPFRVLKTEEGTLIIGKNLDTSTNIELATKSDSSRNASRSRRAMHCLYKFIAKEGERVAIKFNTFKLRGDEPECSKEYVDVYVTFRSDQDLAIGIGHEKPNGRFCTTIMPRRVISLHNMIVLSIYTELPLPLDKKPLFDGNYEFFKKPKSSDQIEAPEPNTLCKHTIYGSGNREGEFRSITYPGSYIKNLKCSYKFIGLSNQRIRLEFLDLDLYSGGSHCPLDSIKIFDGLDEINDPLIQTICSSHRSLVVFSTRNNLLVTFTTLAREMEIQNRGFSAYFEFSEKFIDISYIQGANTKHIRGSECDQRIVSEKGTHGIVVSPKTQHRPNAICRYIFEGLQNALDYEKALVKFLEFDLKTQQISGQELQLASPTSGPTSSSTPAPVQLLLLDALSGSGPLMNGSSAAVGGGSSAQSNSTQSASSSANDQTCPDNYVRLYTSEQKPDQKQDPNDYDYVFCGNEIPQTIESDAASLLMEFNSGTVGGHFKAEYKFIVDYRIPGQQLTSGCNYIYKSDISKQGTFNSPRHPSWYINDMNCTYTFLTRSDESLLLQFSTFKMANSFGEKDVGKNELCRGEDSIHVVELILDQSERKILDQIEIGTYCGTTAPGPLVSIRPVRVTLRTNAERVHYGFSALYNFYQLSELKTNEHVANCGAQINLRQTNQRSGTFASPPTYRSETYEKRNHVCYWNITARPSFRIQLDFNTFAIEGNPAARGCAAAAVRLESHQNKVPIELCGTLDPKNDTARRFVSETEWFAVTFISTKRASGSDGFTATWTEIKKPQV